MRMSPPYLMSAICAPLADRYASARDAEIGGSVTRFYCAPEARSRMRRAWWHLTPVSAFRQAASRRNAMRVLWFYFAASSNCFVAEVCFAGYIDRWRLRSRNSALYMARAMFYFDVRCRLLLSTLRLPAYRPPFHLRHYRLYALRFWNYNFCRAPHRRPLFIFTQARQREVIELPKLIS